jgi:phytoene synthase
MSDDLGALLRRRDPDRFLASLFAPAALRPALWALCAFNDELARAREVASEPTLALIRLHWWREVVEGTRKRHEVATPLSDAVAQGLLLPSDLLAMIDAREAEAGDPFETAAAWRDWLHAGAGGLAVAAARLLGAPDPEAYRPLGAAYGAGGALRSARLLAAHGRCLLPLDALAARGIASAEHFVADPVSDAAFAALADLARTAEGWLRSRGAVAAALPAVLARRDLRRTGIDPAPRGFADKLAVTAAGLTGRI